MGGSNATIGSWANPRVSRPEAGLGGQSAKEFRGPEGREPYQERITGYLAPLPCKRSITRLAYFP